MTQSTTAADTLVSAVRSSADFLLDWVAFRQRHLRVAGVQVAIRVGDEVLIEGAFGTADAENDVPLTTDHLFRIASHSKTFAATACLILKQQGKLRLDDTVAQHLPELAESKLAELTVRELLGHQGGVIRDSSDGDFWQLLRPFPDREQLLTSLQDEGMVFAPNEHFKYSNYGYGLAGLIIERVSGQSFNEFVREHILDVLDLPRVHPDVDDVETDELCWGHSPRLDGDDEVVVLSNPSTESLAAATGFVACARDLSAYMLAHAYGDDRVLDDRSKRVMQRLESIVEVDGQEQGRYGVGLELHTVGERKLIGHSGGFPGFVTRTFVDPKDKLAVSVLTNQGLGPAHEIAVGLVKLIDKAVSFADDKTTDDKNSDDKTADDRDSDDRGTDGADQTEIDLDSFCGRFVSMFSFVQIARLGGRLVELYPTLSDPTGEITKLEVVDADTLQFPAEPGFGVAGEKLVVTRDQDGNVRSARVGALTYWTEDEFRTIRTEQAARRKEKA